MSITYNTEITTVGGSSFATLTSITVPDSVKAIGSYELIIPDSVTISGTGYDIRQIAAGVGAELTGLTKVTFGSGCRIFRAGVFHDCPDLVEAVFTNPINSIEAEELGHSANNPLYNISGVDSNGISINNGALLTGFAYYIFVASTDITSDNKLNKLFKGCSNLSTIRIPSEFLPLEGIFSYDDNSTILKQIKTVTLDATTIIGDGSGLLKNAVSVTFLSINNLTSITKINHESFNNCGAPNYFLDNMTSLKFIGSNAFYSSKITSVTIPATVTGVDGHAFYNCSSLTSVTMVNNTFSPALFYFGDDTTTMGNQFADCPNINTGSLKHLYAFVGSNATYFRKIGFSAEQAFKAEIPSNDALAAGYTQAEINAAYGVMLTINNNVLTDITGFESLTVSVAIPDSVTAINSDACQNKTFIGSLSIPSTVTRILANSFIGCNNLTAVTLPGSRTRSSNSLIPLDANSFALATTPSLIRSNVSVNSLQQLRTQGYTVAQLQDAGFQDVPVTCFGENTRIMCFVDGQEQELMVQDIRNGVLVKTLGSGYKPVCMIGTNKMMNLGNDERVEERLYICKKEKYPELTEDLIITGCHSVLVDDITVNQREKIMDKFGRIMVTEGKYRLTAAMDERAVPHNCAGEFNIYHFALEHDVYVANYGVYANGLLVESCSKRYLAEIANMTMIE